jgi:hypothetical protein
MKKITLATLLAALTLNLGGCFVGGDDDGIVITDDPCFNACEDRQDCYGGEVDCEGLCDGMANDGCDDEYTDVVECLNDANDTCSAAPECDDEQQAFEDCLEPALSGS